MSTEQQIEINLPTISGIENSALTRFAHAGIKYILFIQIDRDPDPVSPQERHDEGAFLVYGHSSFTVNGPAYEKAKEVHRDKGDWEKTYHVYPVYIDFQSGVRFELKSDPGFGDRKWGASMCGYCLVIRDKSIPQPLKLAEVMIEDWNHYLRDDVWGYNMALYRLQTDSEGDAIEERNHYERHAEAIYKDPEFHWGFGGEKHALEKARRQAKALIDGLRRRIM
jgi:hypothetical protein